MLPLFIFVYNLKLREVFYFLFFRVIFLGKNTSFFSTQGVSYVLSYLVLLTLFLSLPFLETKAILWRVELCCLLCVFFFSSSSSFLAWLGFEISSLPIFLIIYLWGKQKEKMQALIAYLLYSVVGATFFLFSIFYLGFFIRDNQEAPSVFWRFVSYLPFIIKLPCFLFHLWLIMAHVEAPTVGRVVLASVLLKLGSFGFFLLSFQLNNLVFIFGRTGLLFLSYYLSSLNNLKLLIAYRRILSMRYFILGVYLASEKGSLASYLIQLTHRITSSLLFLLAGWVQGVRGTLNLAWTSFPRQVWRGFLFLYNSGTYVGLLFLSEVLLLGSSQGVFLFLLLVAVLGSLSYNLLAPIFLIKKISQTVFPPFFGVWALFILNNFFLVFFYLTSLIRTPLLGRESFLDRKISFQLKVENSL